MGVHGYRCDDDSHALAKARAAGEGTTLPDLVREWVAVYASGSSLFPLLTAGDVARLKAARDAGLIPVRRMRGHG